MQTKAKKNKAAGGKEWDMVQMDLDPFSVG